MYNYLQIVWTHVCLHCCKACPLGPLCNNASPISCVTVSCYGKYIERCHLAERREVMVNTASPHKSCQCLPEDDFFQMLLFFLFTDALLHVWGCVYTLCVHITAGVCETGSQLPNKSILISLQSMGFTWSKVLPPTHSQLATHSLTTEKNIFYGLDLQHISMCIGIFLLTYLVVILCMFIRIVVIDTTLKSTVIKQKISKRLNSIQVK